MRASIYRWQTVVRPFGNYNLPCFGRSGRSTGPLLTECGSSCYHSSDPRNYLVHLANALTFGSPGGTVFGKRSFGRLPHSSHARGEPRQFRNAKNRLRQGRVRGTENDFQFEKPPIYHPLPRVLGKQVAGCLNICTDMLWGSAGMPVERAPLPSWLAWNVWQGVLVADPPLNAPGRGSSPEL